MVKWFGVEFVYKILSAGEAIPIAMTYMFLELYMELILIRIMVISLMIFRASVSLATKRLPAGIPSQHMSTMADSRNPSWVTDPNSRRLSFQPPGTRESSSPGPAQRRCRSAL